MQHWRTLLKLFCAFACDTITTGWISKDFILLFVQKNDGDSSNFDSDFTSERAQLTPPDKELLKTMNQHVFKRFSFTSAEALASNWPNILLAQSTIFITIDTVVVISLSAMYINPF